MMDSFIGPHDLAGARRRVEAIVAERCERLGVDDPTDERVVVRMTGKQSLGSQRSRIVAETVCVVADLVLWRSDRTELAALAESLAPDKVLVFVEPTADLGWRRVVHRLGRLPFRLILGHHFEADVPAGLRQAGLVVTTTDRFGVGPLQVRSYVWGEARHFPEL